MSIKLLENVHNNLAYPDCVGSSSDFKFSVVKLKYHYYHYKCDGFNDTGWGCGYRTLQTLCSWVKFRHADENKNIREVPSILEIQDALVAMGDKEAGFSGSRDWIGAVEVSMCLDYFYREPCKIIHVRSGRDLANHIDELREHFDSVGSPVMMGGNMDAASKGVLGVCQADDKVFLLILDPHYVGVCTDPGYLSRKGWVSWQPLESFLDSSFYNLCLPKHK